MSLDKAISKGVEKRKKYYKSKAFDPSCRNHGNCEYCRGNRKHKHDKKIESTTEQLDDLLKFNDQSEIDELREWINDNLH
jgi:hypothetical protein